MNKIIRTLLLFIIFAIALTTYKVAVARDVTSCEEYKDIKEFARCEVTKQWGEQEYGAFYYIIQKESSWVHNEEHNPKLSSAFGLGGFLNATWDTVGCVKTKDEYTQISCTIKYIQKNYHTPSNAKNAHKKNNWY